MQAETMTTPESLALEQAAIVACLADPAKCKLLTGILTPADFWREGHRDIWRAICDTHDAQGGYGVVLVAAKLVERGQAENCGGIDYLRALVRDDAMLMTVHGLSHARQVGERLRAYTTQRELLHLTTEVRDAVSATPDDPATVVSMLQTRLSAIVRAGQFGRVSRALADIGPSLTAAVEADRQRARVVEGMRFGIGDLDDHTGGLRDHSLVLLMGLSHYGKSTLGAQAAFETATAYIGQPDAGTMLVYMLEGGCKRFAARYVSWATALDGSFVGRGGAAKCTEDQTAQIRAAYRQFERLPMCITDTVREFRAIEADVRDHAMKGPVLGVLIDHAQMIEHAGANRALELEAVGARLQALGDEIGAPVMLLSQVTIDMAGEAQAKHAKALWENASLAFNIERGDPGMSLQEKRESKTVTIHLTKNREGELGVFRAVGDFAARRIHGEAEYAAMEAHARAAEEWHSNE